MQARHVFPLLFVLAGAFGAARADDIPSRDQVRAETLAAARAGLIPHGELDLRDTPAAAPEAALTRAQVRAELARASAAGELPEGELDRVPRALAARHPEAGDATPGLSRAEVRRELVAAMRRGELPEGELGRTPAELAPQHRATM